MNISSYVDQQMGLMYGCPVEDVLTGLVIHCRGWRSVYFCPQRKGFLGTAPTTLLQTLVQHKRWADGDLQIFLSRYCPLLLGYKKIPLRHQLSYLPYLLWAANCLPLLYYAIAPSLCLLRGISLFPQVTLKNSEDSLKFVSSIHCRSCMFLNVH